MVTLAFVEATKSGEVVKVKMTDQAETIYFTEIPEQELRKLLITLPPDPQ